MKLNKIDSNEEADEILSGEGRKSKKQKREHNCENGGQMMPSGILEAPETVLDLSSNDAAEMKKTGKRILIAIKEEEMANEKGEAISSVNKVKKKLDVECEMFNAALEHCKQQGCVRTYEGENDTFLVLLKKNDLSSSKTLSTADVKDRVNEAMITFGDVKIVIKVPSKK